MAGLTTSGFTVATTEELRTTIANSLKTNLGGDIDTNPSSRIGQFIDIMAENLSSLWQALEAVYNSQYPSSATGTSLDNVGSITNTQRNPGRYGVARVYFSGSFGTVIPAGTVIANQNGYELTTTTTGTISNNCFLFYAAELPNSEFLVYDWIMNGEAVGSPDFYYNDSPTVIKNKILSGIYLSRSITGCTRNGTTATITTSIAHGFAIGATVVQTGTLSSAFNGTFIITAVPTPTTYQYASILSALTVGSGGTANGTILTASEVEVIGQFNTTGAVYIKITPLISSRVFVLFENLNNLQRNGVIVDVSVINSTDTYIEAVGSVLINQSIEPHSIIELVSAISNIEVVTNIETGISGQQRATDAEYRLQLASDLQNSNSNTVSGIKANLSSLIGVTFVGLIENATSGTVSGRPPFSYEVFVEGGDNDEVAQKIYDTHPPGINIVTTDLTPRSGTYTDVNGTIQTLLYSNVQELNVYVDITGTKNSSYPSNGNTLMIEAIIEYINTREIGEVLYQHNLFTPANTIPGIVSLTIKMNSITPVGAGVNFLTPSNIQRVYLPTGNITVTIT